jgi:hypothetical protein
MFTPKATVVCSLSVNLLAGVFSMHLCEGFGVFVSASARILKGQGYQGFLRKRAGSSFGQKEGNLHCTMKNFKNEKNGQNFTPFRVNKMFSLTF